MMYQTTVQSLVQYLTCVEWISALLSQFEQQYFLDLACKLSLAYQAGITIFPPIHLIFQAFNLTPLSKIKVVILGQDPYPNAGQAMGLAFSVPMGVSSPQSLMNIFKELDRDPNVAFSMPSHGCLKHWANQGVFLLNTTLTVEAGKRNSHVDIGWQIFTNQVIQIISQTLPHVVFILMGTHAQGKACFIDQSKHTVFLTSHPSPLSEGRGQFPFKGSNVFSNTNNALVNHGQTPINW